MNSIYFDNNYPTMLYWIKYRIKGRSITRYCDSREERDAKAALLVANGITAVILGACPL